MKPRTEKIAKPETKLVVLFSRHRANASLYLRRLIVVFNILGKQKNSLFKGIKILSLLVAVIVAFVVASDCWQNAYAKSIGEKYLAPGIHPHL